MKCVQIVGQGVPVRLSDDDAFQIVHRDSDGQYCPKHVWRKFYKAPFWTERGDTGHRRIARDGRLVNAPGA